jgi:hypothetical protein
MNHGARFFYAFLLLASRNRRLSLFPHPLSLLVLPLPRGVYWGHSHRIRSVQPSTSIVQFLFAALKYLEQAPILIGPSFLIDLSEFRRCGQVVVSCSEFPVSRAGNYLAASA